jgi:hypothetical protein
VVLLQHRSSTIVAVFVFSIALACAQEEVRESPVLTNLEVMRTLAGRVGAYVGGTLAAGDSSSVTVTILPKESGWYIEGAFLAELAKKGLHTTSTAPGRYAANIGISDARVEYSDIRRESFLGPKTLNRKVYLQLSAKVTDQPAGTLILAKEFQEVSLDTIRLSDIERVESPHLPVTRGKIPGEGFFSNFAEPLVLIGAIAVAVYLLFSVRS